MIKKSWELRMGDREHLLDTDTGGEAHTIDDYGSLQNGGFFPPPCVSTFFSLFSDNWPVYSLQPIRHAANKLLYFPTLSFHT